MPIGSQVSRPQRLRDKDQVVYYSQKYAADRLKKFDELAHHVEASNYKAYAQRLRSSASRIYGPNSVQVDAHDEGTPERDRARGLHQQYQKDLASLLTRGKHFSSDATFDYELLNVESDGGGIAVDYDPEQHRTALLGMATAHGEPMLIEMKNALANGDKWTIAKLVTEMEVHMNKKEVDKDEGKPGADKDEMRRHYEHIRHLRW